MKAFSFHMINLKVTTQINVNNNEICTFVKKWFSKNWMYQFLMKSYENRWRLSTTLDHLEIGNDSILSTLPARPSYYPHNLRLPNSKLSRTLPVGSLVGPRNVTPILRQLNWLPLKQHIYYRDSIMAFKCMNCLAPEYLSDQFTKRSSISTYKTRNSQLLDILLFN